MIGYSPNTYFYNIPFNALALLASIALSFHLRQNQTTKSTVKQHQSRLLFVTSILCILSQLLLIVYSVLVSNETWSMYIAATTTVGTLAVLFSRASIFTMAMVSAHVLACFRPLSVLITDQRILFLQRFWIVSFVVMAVLPIVSVSVAECMYGKQNSSVFVHIDDIASRSWIAIFIVYDSMQAVFIATTVLSWNRYREKEPFTRAFRRIIWIIAMGCLLDWAALILSVVATTLTIVYAAYSAVAFHAVILVVVFLQLKQLTFYGVRNATPRKEPRPTDANPTVVPSHELSPSTSPVKSTSIS
ncbi:hypothetical protein HDU91_004792 [Kappamyces sp. JEL0680]|nr:hypothetical protein HDU91_004792 [Kappamyces sp. JEL0680]